MKDQFRKDVKRLISEHVEQMHLDIIPDEGPEKRKFLLPVPKTQCEKKEAWQRNLSFASASAYANASAHWSGSSHCNAKDHTAELDYISNVSLDTETIAGKVASLLLLRGLV